MLIKDEYFVARGQYARLYEILCATCKERVTIYQKDGKGPLKRMYIDRIVEENTKHKHTNTLQCKNCKKVLGEKYIYEKEQRLAYRLFVGAVYKKIISAKKIKR